jgi:hypothetical protein
MMKQDSTRAHGRRTGAGSLLLAVLALVTLGGCATGHPLGSLSGGVGIHSRATSWRHDAEPVGALGWLLVLSSAPMTAGNPEHVAFTVRVRHLLDRAGLIARPKAEPVGG